MISISFGNNDHGKYYDYDDKKPGKVYRKVTSDSIIYYHYSKFPPNGPMQYLMPVIERVIPRSRYRDDDNIPWGRDVYYYPPSPPRPIYYPYPPYYVQPMPYPYPYYRTFAATSEPACVDKKDGPLSGLFKWGCDVQKGTVDALNSAGSAIFAATPGGAMTNAMKQKLEKSGTLKDGKIVNKPIESVGSSENCGGCVNNGNFLAYYGCLFHKQICESGTVASGGFDIFAKYMPYFLIGGAAIIVILLLKR